MDDSGWSGAAGLSGVHSSRAQVDPSAPGFKGRRGLCSWKMAGNSAEVRRNPTLSASCTRNASLAIKNAEVGRSESADPKEHRSRELYRDSKSRTQSDTKNEPPSSLTRVGSWQATSQQKPPEVPVTPKSSRCGLTSQAHNRVDQLRQDSRPRAGRTSGDTPESSARPRMLRSSRSHPQGPLMIRHQSCATSFRRYGVMSKPVYEQSGTG